MCTTNNRVCAIWNAVTVSMAIQLIWRVRINQRNRLNYFCSLPVPFFVLYLNTFVQAEQQTKPSITFPSFVVISRNVLQYGAVYTEPAFFLIFSLSPFISRSNSIFLLLWSDLILKRHQVLLTSSRLITIWLHSNWMLFYLPFWSLRRLFLCGWVWLSQLSELPAYSSMIWAKKCKKLKNRTIKCNDWANKIYINHIRFTSASCKSLSESDFHADRTKC